MPQQTALDKLKQLLPAQFEEVVFKLKIPSAYLPSGSQVERAIALIRYVEQQKNGLEELLMVIAQVNSPPSKQNHQNIKKLKNLTSPTPVNFLYDVFLSHNSIDKLRGRRLAEKLKETGLRCGSTSGSSNPEIAFL